MNIKTEWLYVVTDSDSSSSFAPSEITQAKDGHNIAFLFNASISSSNADCQVCISDVFKLEILVFQTKQELKVKLFLAPQAQLKF